MTEYNLPTTLYQIGNSLAVRIPTDILKEMVITKDMKVSIKNVTPDRIEIQFTEPK